MKDYYEVYEDMCEVLNKELSDANEKIMSAGSKMSAGDMEFVDKLTHAIKSIKTVMAMAEAEGGYSNADYSNARYYNEGHSGNSYARRYSRDGRSYARGRGPYAKRDSMGRYSSEGYSRASEDMIRELQDLMEEAPDEGTRLKFQSFIEEMRKR